MNSKSIEQQASVARRRNGNKKENQKQSSDYGT